MAPGSGKRKRAPDRQYSHEDSTPHKMARRDHELEGGRTSRNGRRGSRPGIAADNPNSVPVTPRTTRGSAAPAQPTPQPQQQLQAPPPSFTAPATDTPRTGTPVQAATTPAPQSASAPEVPKEPPAPYAYDYVTDEAVESWEETGRQAVAAAAGEGDEVVLSGVLQELVRAGLDGRLSPAEAGGMVRRIILDQQQAGDVDAQLLFLDALSLLDPADKKSSALRSLLAATDIDPAAIRHVLDVTLLENLSLVQHSFNRIRARKTTNILYRQANFNLLREETEGYAKLLTEYFNIVEAASGVNVINFNVQDAFQRIMALVGAFDLDVGRVLDLTMDVSANALVRSYVFIIKFYRCSSWWPSDSLLDSIKSEAPVIPTLPSWALPGTLGMTHTDEEREQLALLKQSRDQQFWHLVRRSGMDAFFEIGSRRISDYDAVSDLLNTTVEPVRDSKGNEIDADKRLRTNEDRKYMRETRLLPPPGNPDVAQLLGFKLRFYASPARNKDDLLPENLVHFTALLIKIGFVSLRDLYPHLYPPDDQMPEERKRLEKEKAEKDAKERPGGGPNALATAAALTDDSLPASRLRFEKDRSGGATPKPDKNDDTATDELPAPANQKIWLLKTLLTIGDLPDALFILGRFPWLVDVDSSLPPFLHRIVKRMLSKMTEEVQPLADRPDLSLPRDQIDETANPDDSSRLPRARPSAKRQPMKWLGLETISKEGVEGRYYYTDWDESIPICQSVEDVFALCKTFLGFLGPKLGQDHVIYGTLLRTARRSLAEDGSDANRARWLDLMKRLLVPASSFTKHNPGLADELYQLLLLFPVTIRYGIYAEWFTGRTSRQPDVKAAFDHNRAESKDVMRRITNENVKYYSRTLGDISYSSPGVLIMFMINQLESYTNMIPALVECTKYFPKLAYDVMIWCLINSLSGNGRDRIQPDGMLTSSWLQALSQFVASLFYRYSNVNPSPVLQYLASELRKGETTDLEMFEQVLAEMAGIRSDMEFNDQQVLAMAGGELLQAQVVHQLDDTRHARKSSAKRLIKALSSHDLIGQTLVSIAQAHQIYPHQESSKFMPLKVLGNNVDKIQQVLAQYLEVLKTNLTPREFEEGVPDLASLIEEFGLAPPAAFSISRFVLSHRVNEYDDMKRQEEQERKKRVLSNEAKDVEMQEADAKSAVNGDPSLSNGESQEASQPAVAFQPNGSPAAVESPWHPILEPIINRMREVTGDLKDRIGMEFYVTFWTLALPDVVIYKETYAAELKRVENQISELARGVSNLSTSQMQERDRKKKALTELYERLRTDQTRQVGHCIKVSNRLSHLEKKHWFDRSRDRERLDARHAALLQECFLPRAMLSSLDAQYSFLMLKILHEKATPGFSTLHLMAQLFKKQQLAALIFQCTANEAQHLGRFLNETIKLLGTWHSKREIYEKEALASLSKDENKRPGFTLGNTNYDDPKSWNFMEFETFRRQLFNWHVALTSALQLCFESNEYNHLRNGMIVLKAVVQNFPQVNFQGKTILGLIERIARDRTRMDLNVMANSVMAPLKHREKSWVLPQVFRLNDPTRDGKPGSRAPSAHPETPNARDGTPKLNPTAPEFKPTPPNSANRKESAIEDGEVEEAARNADTEMKDVPADKQANNVEKGASVGSRAAPNPPAKDRVEPTSKGSSDAARAYSPVNGSARPEPSRPSAPAQYGPPRGALGQPGRSELRPPPYNANKPLPPAPVARSDTRYPTRRGDDGYGRLDRPADVRPPSREHSPGGRGRGRTPPPASRGPSRDDRPRPTREESWASKRDVPPGGSYPRPSDSRDRVSGSMGPPQPHPDRAGLIPSAATPTPARSEPRPQSSAPVAQSPANEPQGHVSVNPERLRLIEGQDPRESAGQADRDRRRDRDLRDERGAPTSSRQEPRSSVRGPPGGPRDAAPRTDLTPAGPRNGRLTRDTGAESSYGRLQPPQDLPPSGPRTQPPNGPSGRGGRPFPAPPGINTRGHEHAAPSPTSGRAPESPAALRPPQASRHPSERHGAGHQFDRQPPPGSAPTAPASENGPAVHPSRLQNVQQQQPPPLQTDLPSGNGSHGVSSPATAPPSGPRGAGGRAPAGAPTGPSPINNNPPSGPAGSASERQRRDRQRAPINVINAQMRQNNNGPSAGPGQRGGDVSFRGASSRQNSFAANGTSGGGSGPATQANASPMEPPPPRRQDGPPSRPPSRGPTELFAPREDANRPRRREDERPHGSSRDASREQRPRDDDQPPQRPPPPGMNEGRERREGPSRDERRGRDDRDRRESGRGHHGRGDGRDEQPRHQLPQAPGGAFPPGPPPLAEWGRERDDGRGQPRRDGGGRSSGRAEDFGRGGSRRGGDERRDASGRGLPRDEGMDSRSLKRPHEGPGWDMEGSKRRRSGK
jgi:THO complex subunit 2